jgi:hypothetical protein
MARSSTFKTSSLGPTIERIGDPQIRRSFLHGVSKVLLAALRTPVTLGAI